MPRKSRFRNLLIGAGLFLTFILGSAGCNFGSGIKTPGVDDAAPRLKTPGVSQNQNSRVTEILEADQTPGVDDAAHRLETGVTYTPQTLEPTQTSTPTTTPSPTQEQAYQVIGRSVEGQLLEVYRFGSGANRLMIVAGIHGGYEPNTSALAEELITYLQEHPDTIPADKTLYILPNLNPDGLRRGKGPDGRANANGVDLNRNFPANWQKDYRRSGCWQERPITAGSGPASEPETQALIAFVEAHPDIQAMISYHSAALGIFPGGLPPDPDSIRLAEELASVSGYKYPPMDTGCIYTGELANWATTKGITAVDIELTNHRDTDFDINLKVLNVFLKWQKEK